MQHSIGNFVDRSVASRREDEVTSAFNLFARLRRSTAWGGGRHQTRFDVLTRQRGGAPLQQILPARETPGNGVVNNSGAFGVDGFQVPYFDIPASEIDLGFTEFS